MSIQKEESSVPPRKEFKFKAILAVKNAPIHINLERENELLIMPKQPEIGVETQGSRAVFKKPDVRMTKFKNMKNKRSANIRLPVNSIKVPEDDEFLTEGVIKFHGSAKRGKYAAETNKVDAAVKKSVEIEDNVGQTKRTKLAENVPNIITIKPKIPQEKNQVEEVKRAVKRKIDECDDYDSERAKEARGYVAPLIVLKHLRENRVRAGAKAMLGNMEKSTPKKNGRVTILVRNNKGRRSNLHATLVNIDANQNMMLADIIQVWKRKIVSMDATGEEPPLGTKRTVPHAGITEKHLGNGIWLCQKHIPKLFLRGKHVIKIITED